MHSPSGHDRLWERYSVNSQQLVVKRWPKKLLHRKKMCLTKIWKYGWTTHLFVEKEVGALLAIGSKLRSRNLVIKEQVLKSHFKENHKRALNVLWPNCPKNSLVYIFEFPPTNLDICSSFTIPSLPTSTTLGSLSILSFPFPFLFHPFLPLLPLLILPFFQLCCFLAPLLLSGKHWKLNNSWHLTLNTLLLLSGEHWTPLDIWH